MTKKKSQTPPAAKTKQQDAKPASTGKTLLSRKDIRREYGISEKSLYRIERRGLLKAVRVLRMATYFRSDLEACLRASMSPECWLSVSGQVAFNSPASTGMGTVDKEVSHV